MSQEIVNGLIQLGFDSGWVVSGNEITVWKNEQPQPSYEKIMEAAKKYVPAEPTVEEKLASVGLSLSDLKSALGLE
jgi:hypothetical protein